MATDKSDARQMKPREPAFWMRGLAYARRVRWS